MPRKISVFVQLNAPFVISVDDQKPNDQHLCCYNSKKEDTVLPFSNCMNHKIGGKYTPRAAYRSSSMTTLLTHTVAHSTKPSYRPKTNNQSLKKFLSLALG